jgi:hypothetical protein
MAEPLSESKKYIFFGLIVISLGVIYNTTLTDTMGSIGMVFMALGGLFFIVGMRKRKQELQDKQEDDE